VKDPQALVPAATLNEEERMATVKTTPVSNIGTQDYEPFIHEEKPFGEVHWLRTESGGDGVLFTGLWTHDVAEIPGYVFPGDETMHVLEGEATIVVEGETVTLRPGDIASFTKGQSSDWTITQPFKKFFVISG
jgi:uncharacterized cupin superfamily protein